MLQFAPEESLRGSEHSSPTSGMPKQGRAVAFFEPDQRPLAASRAFVDQDDIDAVVEVLRGERLSDGPGVRRFEKGLCKESGASHAVAVSSGSAARHALYHALGVGVGRTVMMAANAPAAAALSAQVCGGEVEFVDIDARTANLDTARLEERLSRGSVPHVVTAVHCGGLPCDMEWLLALRSRHDFELIEDGAFAFGARYRVDGLWYRVGEHPGVRATVLSFHPDQHITTGEGGAILTSDGALAERLCRLRSHGIDPEVAEDFASRGDTPGGPCELGFNYRMSELQAALGVSQLKKLPEFLSARREIAMRYMAELRDFEFLQPGVSDLEHAYGRFCVRAHADERGALLRFLCERGVHTGEPAHSLPLSPWFQSRGDGCEFPNAKAHAERSIALPIYPALSEAEQARVIRALADWRARKRRAA